MKIKDLLIVLSLVAIMALFNSQMDVIHFRPTQAWFNGWWIASNWQQPAWQKYLLPMSVDGWHLCKFIMLSALSSIIVYSLKIKWYWWVVIMLSWGALFNIFYSL